MLAPTLHPTSFVSPRAMSDTEDCERPTAAPISCCVMPHPIRSVTSSFHFIGDIIGSPITKVNRKTDIKPRKHTRMKKRPTRAGLGKPYSTASFDARACNLASPSRSTSSSRRFSTKYTLAKFGSRSTILRVLSIRSASLIVLTLGRAESLHFADTLVTTTFQSPNSRPACATPSRSITSSLALCSATSQHSNNAAANVVTLSSCSAAEARNATFFFTSLPRAASSRSLHKAAAFSSSVKISSATVVPFCCSTQRCAIKRA